MLENLTDRQRISLLVVPTIIVAIAGSIGSALLPTLLVEAPLLLVALVPRNQVLVLVAPQLDFWPFFLVGTVRLLITDPMFFLVGRYYGPRAVAWIEQRSESPGSVARFERWFQRAAYPVVAIAPNNLICTIAGASKMPVRGFLIANFTGTVVRMLLIWWLGEIFAEPLTDIANFIGEYRWYFTALTVALVAYSIYRGRRRGTSPIESIDEAVHELEGDETP